MNKQINISLVVFFLSFNGLMNAMSKEEQWSQLVEAARKGDIGQARQLLAAKVNPNIANKEGRTPLLEATIEGRDKIVQMLLAAGADPNKADNWNNTPLSVAVSWRRDKIARKLLAAGADPNIARKDGVTPLWWAASKGEIEIAQRLLAAGANPTIKDEEGKTPADVAKTSKIKNYIEEKIKKTKPLLDGAKMGRIDVIRNALKTGALVNMPDESGNTPLHLAIMSGNLDAVKYLLQFAKNINFLLKNNKGQTAINLAIALANLSALDLIKQATELKKKK